MTSPADIFDIWFGEYLSDVDKIVEGFELWFDPETNPAFDRYLSEGCGETVVRAARGEFDHWSSTAHGSLALILLFDQLPRNIYRGTRSAFATDARALETTVAGIRRGFDQALTIAERIFFYIPFEHDENLDSQERCCRLYTMLDAIAEPPLKDVTEQSVQASAEHRDVIRRFGRFPQRNAVLGRKSTPAELAWLEAHHGWGQKQTSAADALDPSPVLRPGNQFERYHAHVYYIEGTRKQARLLCRRAGERFGIEVGKFHDKPVGPHPFASCQLSFDAAAFDAVVGWLDANRNGLTVFVHGLSGNDYQDHTANASWLGDAVPLDLSLFDS